MKFEKLPISSILDKDESFRIGYGPPSKRLAQSILKVGIINPVWVRADTNSTGRFRLVSGYSRFHVAKINNISPLPCLVIEEDIPDSDILLANIYDNLSHGELNPVEKALALKKSVTLLGKARVIEEIMPSLELAPSKEILEKTIRILELEGSILSAIAKGSISPSNAFALLSFQKEEQGAVFHVFQSLKLGVNLQKEFMENLFECSRRDGISVDNILESNNLKSIYSDDKKPERERAEMMRTELRRMRYPNLSEMEASFNECARSMKPAPQVKILPPPFFETQDFTVHVRFRTPGELLAHLEKLGDAFRSPHVKRWFQNHSLKGCITQNRENVKSD